MVKSDYDSGIRGLKQIWKSIVWRIGIVSEDKEFKDPDMRHATKFIDKMRLTSDEADEIFSKYTAKFLDRTGFHEWWSGE
jgi:hypothetical protein